MACSREPWMRILFTCCLAESRALSVHKYMYVGYKYVHFEKDVCSARGVTQTNTEVLVRREYTSRHEERDIFAFGPRLGPRGPARLELLLPKSLSLLHIHHIAGLNIRSNIGSNGWYSTRSKTLAHLAGGD